MRGLTNGNRSGVGVARAARGRILVVAAVTVACGGGNNEHLRARDRSPDAAGGAAGAGGMAAEDGGPVGDASGFVDGSAPDRHVPVVDAGFRPGAVTLLHAATDVDHMTFCFARAEPSERPSAAPFPEGGLTFGASVAIASLPGVDLEADAIRPIVIAGDLSLIAGLDCADALARVDALADAGGPDGGPVDASSDAASTTDAAPTPDAAASDGSVADGSIDAGADAMLDGAAGAAGAGSTDGGDAAPPPVPPPVPPSLRSFALPVIPAGTFTEGRSFLLAAVGCIGGPAFRASIEQIACGVGYDPTSPTLRPVIVAVSRETMPGRLGVQVLNAMATPDRLDVDSVPGRVGRPVGIVDDLVSGALGPKRPVLDFERRDYGAPLGPSLLEVRIGGSSSVSLSTTWQAVLDRAGLEELKDGRTYTLVTVGPRAGVTTGSWWNGSAITVIDNDPLSP